MNGINRSFLLLLAWPVAAAALDTTAWKNHQPIDVTAPGLVRLDLPVETLDAALPDRSDLRLVDAAGVEQPFDLHVVRDTGREIRRRPVLATQLAAGGTELIFETDTAEALEAIVLESPHPHFLKAARVELSTDGETWTLLGEGLPVFRQWGAEQLRLALDRRRAARVRITLDDARSPPVPITGAMLVVAAGEAPELPLAAARIVRQEEFAGETVLTVALDGRHAPLAQLELETPEPLFTRRVSVAVRDLHAGTATERTVAGGTIYRLQLDGAPVRAGLEIPLNFDPATRELLVHIHNGDSPPLRVSDVRVRRRNVTVNFYAAAAGRYTLLSGNPRARAPHYDLSLFAGDLRRAVAVTASVGKLETNAAYRAPEVLADVSLTGAAFNPLGWTRNRVVQTAGDGVQELELDIYVLARTRPDLADVRLVRDGLQVPFLLERTPLQRSLSLSLAAAGDPKRPGLSRWSLTLPRTALPVQQLVFSSATPLFQRELRVYEKLTSSRGDVSERVLARAMWSRTPAPGASATFAIALSGPPQTDTLWIETENGDNPPIALELVRVTHPVARLVFKAGAADRIVLHYGKPDAAPPRYDLGLVANQLLAAERGVAALTGTAEDMGGNSRLSFASFRGGPLFWAALGLVVVVLLAVVAKLLPKPPAA